LLSPGASVILAELAMEAGLPDGVLNIVHGTNDTVNAICDDEDIRAVSFVGSNTAGMHIYARAAAKGKRIQVKSCIFSHLKVFLAISKRHYVKLLIIY
jgi:malonate-semialdehyde dehydrogenase (acetylating)/methylmalonate-semialdehyde dehydrogenase